RAFVALLAGFLWFHWVALIEIQSGSAVLQRLASWRLPLWAEVPLFVWGAALLVTAAHDGLERLKDGGAGLPPAAALLAVLPVVYAAVFVVFRNTSSVRYYVVISHLIVLAVAARWSWPSTRPGRNDAAALLVGAALAHALSWGAVLGPGSRAPLMFRVGWHKEKSHDFVDKSGLFESVARAGACEVEYNENQLDVLLHFDRLVYPRRCVPGRRVRASYCWSCPPPVISAEFTEAR
ncbi:MAG: hypothetical protein HY928_07640, partial [Elusimicrobia bacterium]|nr:hypothetical protein [Elusimicrobiota bacterium]